MIDMVSLRKISSSGLGLIMWDEICYIALKWKARLLMLQTTTVFGIWVNLPPIIENFLGNYLLRLLVQTFNLVGGTLIFWVWRHWWGKAKVTLGNHLLNTTLRGLCLFLICSRFEYPIDFSNNRGQYYNSSNSSLVDWPISMTYDVAILIIESSNLSTITDRMSAIDL